MAWKGMTQGDYLAWERRLGFDKHGGLAKAAEALGTSEKTIQRLRNGDGDYQSKTMALAMAAVEAGVSTWPESAGRLIDVANETDGVTAMFTLLEEIGRRKTGGHLTIMRFTTNWRVGFRTPNDREDIEAMPAGRSFVEAARLAVVQAVTSPAEI